MASKATGNECAELAVVGQGLFRQRGHGGVRGVDQQIQ